MVTKLISLDNAPSGGSVLAKIHMVTKLCINESRSVMGSVLAKIHMVTKLGSPIVD